MSKEQIKQLITSKVSEQGLIESGIKGVQLFNITKPIRCAPAVYEPSITAIVSGNKEAIWGGNKRKYDNSQYFCCSMSMPVEAGTPEASKDNPLIGVYISLDTKVMTELVIEMANALDSSKPLKHDPSPLSVITADWDPSFTDALLRLLQLGDNPLDAALLTNSRLREFYYSVLKGSSGKLIRHSFDLGNEMAHSITLLCSHLNEQINISEMASKIGMSRAVFHRKFKLATNMSPIQFVKAMRLNHAAMKIAKGTNVSLAAMEVGYVSSSQFSREFKRMYGASPKQWSQTNAL